MCTDAAVKSLRIDNIIAMLEKSIFYEEKSVEEACWRYVISSHLTSDH